MILPAKAVRELLKNQDQTWGIASMEKAGDGKPGKSLAETSTEELQQTLKDIKHRKGASPDPGLDKRSAAIQAELKRRGDETTEKSIATAALDNLAEFVGAGDDEPLEKAKVEATEKSTSGLDALEEHLEKAKYIKRTGTPGNYRYEYAKTNGGRPPKGGGEPKGKAETKPADSEGGDWKSLPSGDQGQWGQRLSAMPVGTQIRAYIGKTPHTITKTEDRKWELRSPDGTTSSLWADSVVNFAMRAGTVEVKPGSKAAKPKQKTMEKSMTTTALDTLGEYVDTDGESLSKGMILGGYGLDWANRVTGTPFEVDALQCLKDSKKIEQERQEMWKKYHKPWSEEACMDPVERAKLRKKRDAASKKFDTKADAVRKRQDEIERKYLDWRIEQAKEAKKSEGEDGDETLMKALPSEKTDITPEKARQILHDGEVGGKPLTEAQRGMFGAIAGRGKVKKSMSGIEALEERLEKADIPTGQPTKLPTGDTGNPEDGGPLAGVGKQAGSPTSPTGTDPDTPAPKLVDWSLEEDARRVLGGGTMKPLGSLAQDRAIAESRLKKGVDDIHPYRTSVVHGDAEARIAALYKGGANEANPRNAVIFRDVLCKSCGGNHPAMLTACPRCGGGTVGREVLSKSNPSVILELPKGAPILQPPPREKDLSF